LPDVPVVLGGIYATLYPDHAKRFSGADVVMTGQAENQIVQWICGQFELKQKKHYRHIDDYPFPAYDLYTKTGHAALLTTRGCPFQCSFCATNRFYDHFVQRSPELVVKELSYYHDQLKIREIAFYDDALFAFADRHIIPILKSVINRGMNFHFHSPNGLFARYVDQELAELMVNSGFKTIRLSFESSDHNRQKDMKKVSNIDLFNAITYLVRAGFPGKDIKVYLLMGLSGQLPQEVEDSIRFVHDLGVRISMSSYSPIPGTAEWNNDLRHLPALEHEPLLTNKSIYPMKNERFTYDDYEKLKSMVSRGNRSILDNHK
jgi:radical SAM superfamily enzyme YgiQ (UPF0313 family)